MNKIKVYSPVQAAAGSFLGGPVASAYILRNNFMMLNNEKMADKTLKIGWAVLILMLLSIPFIPSNFPQSAIPVSCLVITKMIAERYQMKKNEIAVSDQYTFHSNWRVVGVSLVCFMVFMALVLGVAVIYSSLGFAPAE